jgi:hypothetical protein
VMRKKSPSAKLWTMTGQAEVANARHRQVETLLKIPGRRSRKSGMEKRMAELLDADRKRKEEEAKAAKLSKILESWRCGSSRQTGSFLFVALFP